MVAKVFTPGIKPLLTQARSIGVTPEFLLSDGQEAGDFAIKYLIEHAVSRVRKRVKPQVKKLKNKPNKIYVKLASVRIKKPNA